MKKILWFILLLVSILLVRIFVFALYKIPSESMSPAIQAGDYILVNKLCYGPRVVKPIPLFFNHKLEHHWFKGLRKPRKDDIIVFNWPRYNSLDTNDVHAYGVYVVKRCFGMPDSTVCITATSANKPERYSLIGEQNFMDEHKPLFPNDTTLHWTLDNYGPIQIPGKEKAIELNSKNINIYKHVLFYEGYVAALKNDSVYLNGVYAAAYTFKYNYYFMLGDNFYASEDSRYWGFVSETHIVGRAFLVLFSLDPNESRYKKFRWNRFFRQLE